MDRREFLLALALAPSVLAHETLAYVTADTGPDGRPLWVSLGTAPNAIAVVDVSDPRRPRHAQTVKPPFLAHDVGWAPSGRAWITSGEASRISAHGRMLAADAAPQHVTFLGD